MSESEAKARFKRGDVREDGFVFWCYKGEREYWVTLARFESLYESNRKWVEENQDKRRETERKYREKNPQKAREARRRWDEANP